MHVLESPRPEGGSAGAEVDRHDVDRQFEAIVESSLRSLSSLSLSQGGVAGVHVADRLDRLADNRRAHAVWIVVVVAIATVAAVGILAWAMAYCVARGGSYDGGLSVSTNGWRVWEYKLGFYCTQ